MLTSSRHNSWPPLSRIRSVRVQIGRTVQNLAAIFIGFKEYGTRDTDMWYGQSLKEHAAINILEKKIFTPAW